MNFGSVRFNDSTNCVDEMTGQQQADTFCEYLEDENAVYQMLMALVENGGSAKEEAALTDFVSALKQAFASDLTRAGAQKWSREAAFHELGRQMYCHAHRYAKARIDEHIEDNWDDLVWETNRPDTEN